MTDVILNKTIEYLNTDHFKNLSTLKFISRYKEHLIVNMQEDNDGWAVLVTIPTSILSYDTLNYPQAEKAVFLNGTSVKLKYKLLYTLPRSNYILRLNENLNLSKLENQYKITKGNTFISYSCTSFDDTDSKIIVPGSTSLTDEAINIFKRNNYSEDEIRQYFNNGSVWFGYTVDNKLVSACFIYQNYEDIWEIAGVHTLEAERNKGYARIVVTSALSHLIKRKLIPRYEAEIRNTKSLKLAQSLGMKEFLRIKHFLLSPLKEGDCSSE